MSAGRPDGPPYAGGCLCGKVRFTVDGPLDPVTYCHCGQCRRQSGHVLAATGAPIATISIEGEGELTWFAASKEAERGFCRHCGSHMFWKPASGHRIAIMAGALDGPVALVQKRHIFVSDKPDWYEITDDLPQAQVT